jgi:hypothetical protein
MMYDVDPNTTFGSEADVGVGVHLWSSAAAPTSVSCTRPWCPLWTATTRPDVLDPVLRRIANANGEMRYIFFGWGFFFCGSKTEKVP